MKKTILTALLISICTGSLPAAVNSDSFFPLEKGFSWVYDTTKKTKKEPEHFEMKVVVEGPWKEKEFDGMILTQTDKRGKMREFLTHDAEKGVFIYKLGLSKALTPEVFTRFTPAGSARDLSAGNRHQSPLGRPT